MNSLPGPLRDYVTRSGFWNGAAEYEFWYAIHDEEWYWLHLRRHQNLTLAVTIFHTPDGHTDLELYDLTRAAVHGLRSTIVNTPLMTLQRYEPPLPVVALHLRDGASTYFTLPRTPQSVADQWFGDVLRRLLAALSPRWRLMESTWEVHTERLRALWPSWAGPLP